MIHEERHLDTSIWMTDLVAYPATVLPLSTVPAALATIGLLPYLLSAVFVLLAGQVSLEFVAIQTLAATIAAVGPVLVRHYDEDVFPTFVTEVDDVVADDDVLFDTVARYKQFFARRYWLVTIPWTGLIVATVVANVEFFELLGVTGLTDPAFLVYLVFAVWWGVITSIGFHGAITTVLCVRAVGNLELEIDPLHHDGLGGLSTIGYFSIRATLMISIGSFALPLAFAIAAGGGYETLVHLAVAAYVGLILASFVYPTAYIHKRAQEVRDDVLREKRRQIRELKEQATVSAAGGELSELETQLKIQTLRDDFHEYESVNLYPLSLSILSRLVSSVLLPVTFTLLETYVFTG